VRLAKLAPPPLPAGYVERPALHELLDECFGRRLAAVVAGAGFGKSTLVAAWSADTVCAWCTLDRSDASLPQLAASLEAALRTCLPSLPERLAPAAERSAGAVDSDASRVEALAGLLCESLEDALASDLVLVLDDVHELDAGGPSARLLDGLARQAPPQLRLVLVSRNELPFPVARLRGRGQMLELDAPALAYSADEVAAFLRSSLGTAAHADEIHELTGGWPAAVRLAAESLRAVPEEEHSQAMLDVRRPRGPLFAYLAEEVLSREPAAVRDLLRLAAPLERVEPELLEELGVRDAGELLAGLARRSLFVQREPGAEDAFSVHGLVRAYVAERWPLTEDELRSLHFAAAERSVERGDLTAALSSLVLAGDRGALSALLSERGEELLMRGAVEEVRSAAARLATESRDAWLEQVIGEAHALAGDWGEALACYERAAAGATGLAPGLAWRIGRIHWDRGDYEQALEACALARLDGTAPSDEARLLALRSVVHWHRTSIDDAAEAAAASLAAATVSREPRALAAAHYAGGLAALARDEVAFEEHTRLALEAAEEAGDLLQSLRARILIAGPLPPPRSVGLLDEAVGLAELAGADLSLAAALHSRGSNRRQMGRLDEAAADLERARSLWMRHGSNRVGWELSDLGAVFLERGDLARARAMLEQALSAIEQHPEGQGLAAARSRLARVLVHDEPERAAELAAQAIETGRAIAFNAAEPLLAAGWIALVRGERKTAALLAGEAAASVPPGDNFFPEALELRALSAPDPGRERALLEEALVLWREMENEIRAVAVELALARLATPPNRAEIVLARRKLQRLGVRESAAGAAGLLMALGPEEAAPLALQTLGAFRVLREGEPLPAAAWRSKRAKEALKMLVARRGRPISRAALIEALWPEEDPARTVNRLSVALSTVRANVRPELVLSDAEAVSLDVQAIDVDVENFLAQANAGLSLLRAGRADDAHELLESAESLYTGDFLEENPYDDWAVPLREEARAAYISMAGTLAELAQAAGDHDAAIRYRLRMVERDAFDEQAHLGLVSAFAAAGRHGEARRAYAAYVSRLASIGAEPAPFSAAK
jgi:DNA-binding SARP family transcriptional activator